tara:strand:- start:578 stop:1084 length:507 start_codon:yes stop_codon:yes gene_type:complete
MKKYLIVLLVSLGLQTQAQQSWCDSLEYFTLPTPTLTVTGEAIGISNMVDSIRWNFTACNSVACYSPQGNDPYSFPLINYTDTVKFCYDVFIYYDTTTIICNHCDSLVYNQNSYQWILFSMSNPVGIEELMENKGINNNKIYDLMGRELLNTPKGVMYIRNRKLYINK